LENDLEQYSQMYDDNDDEADVCLTWSPTNFISEKKVFCITLCLYAWTYVVVKKSFKIGRQNKFFVSFYMHLNIFTNLKLTYVWWHYTYYSTNKYMKHSYMTIDNTYAYVQVR
jgi:hypothetical protein